MTEIRPTCMVCGRTIQEKYCYTADDDPVRRSWDLCICADCIEAARKALPDNIIRETFEEDWSERWIRTPLLWE